MRRKVVYSESLPEYCGGFRLSKEAQKMMAERGYKIEDIECGLVPRHNKDLVEVVELLGKKAGGYYNALKVAELAEGCSEYQIISYDGWEEVVTPGTMDWIKIQ